MNDPTNDTVPTDAPLGDEPAQQPDETYANKIEITPDMLPDSASGDDVQVTIAGKLIENDDGSRCIQVTEVDGAPLASSQDDSGQMGQGEEEDPTQSAADSIKQALMQKNKGGRMPV